MSDKIANLSTLYRGLPRDQRPAAAAADGFTRVESWWDFDSATPADAELQGFLDAIEKAGVQLTAINSHGGDRAAGERGLACLPDREDEFKASIEGVCRVAEATGARSFNVTIGQLDDTRWTPEEQFAVAAQRYRWAAEKVGAFGGTILIEALCTEGNGAYPFHTGADVVEFLDAHLADVPNIGYLFDTFHLAANGVDVVEAFPRLARSVRHVQWADFPGRGAPGTGDIDFAGLIAAMTDAGYTGSVALEYLG